jgi:hypothetical protein
LDAPETREAEALDVRLASFSASSRALITECGTDITRRANSVNRSKSPVSFFAGAVGRLAIISLSFNRRKGRRLCAKSQYSEIADVLETPHDYPPKWALMLTAYFDESFQSGNGYVVMAGFLGDKESWEKCAEAWRLGLGKKKKLHMKQLNWKYAGRYKDLLEKLGAIPHACGLQPIFTAVRLSDYAIAKHVSKTFRHGYFVSLAAAAMVVLETLPKGERVKLVFETQAAYAAVRDAVLQLIQDMPDYKKKRKKLLLGWESSAKSILLEPSDYLAYAIMQTLADPLSERAQLCAPILRQGKKRIGGKLTEKEVAKIIPLMKESYVF